MSIRFLRMDFHRNFYAFETRELRDAGDDPNEVHLDVEVDNVMIYFHVIKPYPMEMSFPHEMNELEAFHIFDNTFHMFQRRRRLVQHRKRKIMLKRNLRFNLGVKI